MTSRVSKKVDVFSYGRYVLFSTGILVLTSCNSVHDALMPAQVSENSLWEITVGSPEYSFAGRRHAEVVTSVGRFSVYGVSLDRWAQTDPPSLSLLWSDSSESIRVDLSKLSWLGACGAIAESNITTVDVVLDVPADEPGRWYERTIDGLKPFDTHPGLGFWASVRFDFDPNDLRVDSCTLRLREAIELPDGEEIPDVYLERGQWTYQW